MADLDKLSALLAKFGIKKEGDEGLSELEKKLEHAIGENERLFKANEAIHRTYDSESRFRPDEELLAAHEFRKKTGMPYEKFFQLKSMDTEGKAPHDLLRAKYEMENAGKPRDLVERGFKRYIDSLDDQENPEVSQREIEFEAKRAKEWLDGQKEHTKYTKPQEEDHSKHWLENVEKVIQERKPFQHELKFDDGDIPYPIKVDWQRPESSDQVIKKYATNVPQWFNEMANDEKDGKLVANPYKYHDLISMQHHLPDILKEVAKSAVHAERQHVLGANGTPNSQHTPAAAQAAKAPAKNEISYSLSDNE